MKIMATTPVNHSINSTNENQRVNFGMKLVKLSDVPDNIEEVYDLLTLRQYVNKCIWFKPEQRQNVNKMIETVVPPEKDVLLNSTEAWLAREKPQYFLDKLSAAFRGIIDELTTDQFQQLKNSILQQKVKAAEELRNLIDNLV